MAVLLAQAVWHEQPSARYHLKNAHFLTKEAFAGAVAGGGLETAAQSQAPPHFTSVHRIFVECFYDQRWREASMAGTSYGEAR